ncbi:MAG: HAMP domain-containing histidine kinase [Deltaproteobacteria bacterium]|nr:HAMP domain-containing histidine kinase [Deltaproteobacteria bacterium]
MQYQPVEKLRNFFVGHHLARADDCYEEAKIRLIFNFMAAFYLVAIAFIPILFEYRIRLFSYINFAMYPLLLLSMFALRYTRSPELPTFLFAATVVLFASANSIFNNGELTLNISVWYFLAVAFAAYTARAGYVIALVILIYACLAIIHLLKYLQLLSVNPQYSEAASLSLAPFIMLVTLPFVLKILSEYGHTKDGAITRFKSSIEEKNRILGVVAHDLRNPIGAAMNCIEMAQRFLQGGNADHANKYFGMANDSCQRALAQIEELLTFSTLREDARKLTFETTNAVPFIAAVVEAYKLHAGRKQITLEFGATVDELFVSINKLHFSRAVDNVLSNAIKFTEEGGHIDVCVQKVGENARISVADTGIGIPDSLKDSIFSEFTPSARKGTQQEHSTGLGMAITKKIVTLLDGRIWFESEEGKGTTFHLELPLHRPL